MKHGTHTHQSNKALPNDAQYEKRNTLYQISCTDFLDKQPVSPKNILKNQDIQKTITPARLMYTYTFM